MEEGLKNIRDEIKEENRLLHRLLKSKADTFNTILGVVGAVLALAGVVGLVYSILADKKMGHVSRHVDTIRSHVQTLHDHLVTQSKQMISKT